MSDAFYNVLCDHLHQEGYEEGYKDGYEAGKRDVANPWHKVEEPPEEEGKYLVYDGRGNYYVAWWGQRLGWCYDPKFFCYWMPIEPPKEDA